MLTAWLADTEALWTALALSADVADSEALAVEALADADALWLCDAETL